MSVRRPLKRPMQGWWRRNPYFIRYMAREATAPFVAVYALSPIDLIPDFIPVLGYLDDLVIVPLGLLAVIRLLPTDVLTEARTRAAAVLARPRSRVAAVCFVLIWLATAAWLVRHGLAQGWLSFA